MTVVVAITARQNAKLDARKRAYARLYVTFDHLPAPCRAAHREAGGWDGHALQRCRGRVCDHGKENSQGTQQAC